MSENGARNYKKTYERMRENIASKSSTPPEEEEGIGEEVKGEYYVRAGQTRNIVFQWLNGKKLFLNYSYLVSVEYSAEETEVNVLTLGFTSHTVRLEGYRLEDLFDKLVMHLPAIIVQQDERYAATSDEKEPIITNIDVTSTEMQKGSAEAEPFV